MGNQWGDIYLCVPPIIAAPGFSAQCAVRQTLCVCVGTAAD